MPAAGALVMFEDRVHRKTRLRGGSRAAVRQRSGLQPHRIYEDLIAEPISIDRAILELQGLTKRQKGGWLGGWLGEQLQEARVALVGGGRREAAALDQR